jgi:hypothetical protein
MRTTSLWAMVALVAVVVGCGDAPGTSDAAADLAGGGDAGSTDMSIPEDAIRLVTATQFDTDLAQAICAHLLMCGQLDAASMAACIEANTTTEPADRDTEILKGRMSINELQCLQAVMNSRCDGADIGQVTIGKCERLLFKPMQPSDGVAQCISSVECVNGYCARTAVDGGAIPPEGCSGVCKPFTAINSTNCVSDEECNIDVAKCDVGGTGKCVALPGANGDCSSDGRCQAGMFCASTMRCVQPVAPGQLNDACDPLQSLITSVPACDIGLYCKASTGHCATKLTAGALCVPSDTPLDFADNQCTDGNACFQTMGQANPQCQAIAGVTQACDAAQPFSCKTTTFCDATTHACKALIPDGQPCDTSAPRCLSGSAFGLNTCVGGGATGQCAPMKAFNQACNPATDANLCPSPDVCSATTNRCALLCSF